MSIGEPKMPQAGNEPDEEKKYSRKEWEAVLKDFPEENDTKISGDFGTIYINVNPDGRVMYQKNYSDKRMVGSREEIASLLQEELAKNAEKIKKLEGNQKQIEDALKKVEK
jgi:hypothetical protein